ncbi:MAG: cation transporter [Magnetococcales bacterium]|nr:cation transporter [Magnetococcales bacterium]
MASVRLDLAVVAAQAVFNGSIGFLAGSVAVHAFALQFIGDLMAKGVNYLGLRASFRPPDANFPYGYGKVQFLTAMFVGMALLAGSVSFMAYNVIHIHEGKMEMPSALAIAGMLVTAATCEIMYRYLSCVGRENNNLVITAAAWDNRNDALSAMVVLLGVVASRLGAVWADHVVALVVSLLVIRAGLVIVTDAVKGLLDARAPAHILAEVADVVNDFPEILHKNDFRGRRLGDTWELDLSLRVDAGMSVNRLHHLEAELMQRIYQRVPHTGHIHIRFIPNRSS